MHTVDALYVGGEYLTSVWISGHADKALSKMADSRGVGKLLDKIEYWSRSGFEKFEGAAGSGRPIVPEWDGVYRLGYATLHRVIGFYEDDDKRCFVAFDAYLKRGQRLSAAERKRIDEVGRVKRDNLWRKRDHERQ